MHCCGVVIHIKNSETALKVLDIWVISIYYKHIVDMVQNKQIIIHT